MAQMRWERDNLFYYDQNLAEREEESFMEKRGENYNVQGATEMNQAQKWREMSLCAAQPSCCWSEINEQHMQRSRVNNKNVQYGKTNEEIKLFNQNNHGQVNDKNDQLIESRPSDAKHADEESRIHKQKKGQRLTKSIVVKSTIDNQQALILLLSIVSLIFETSLFCVCDNQHKTSAISNNHSLTTMAKKQQQEQIQLSSPESKIAEQKQQPPLKSRYKDKLITYLSDEIEKKHFSLSGKSRPSKFDNGQEIDFIQLDIQQQHDKSQSTSRPRALNVAPHSDHRQQQHSSTAAMNDVMRMHELANQKPKQQSQVSTSSKRSRAINPVKLMASMVLSPNDEQSSGSAIGHKLVSNLVNTYITPYILGMSQAKSFQYSDPSTMYNKVQDSTAAAASNTLQVVDAQQQATSGSNKLQNPSILSSLVAGRGSKSGFRFPEMNPLKLLLSPTSSTMLPLPIAQHRPSNYHKPITSTTLSPISSIQFSDLKDPMDSSESNSLLSPTAFISPAANTQADLSLALNSNEPSISESALGNTHISEGVGNGGGVSASGKQKQQANKWLRNSMMSQLVQGSLRDILALTQLPIGGGSAMLASASQTVHNNQGPISSMLFSRPPANKKLSTAPSVLESNSKHKLSAHEMALGSRIIEEVLRFAYILTSGVRTKRDPYLALIETPKPSAATTTSASDLGNSLSQRSTQNNQQVSDKKSSSQSVEPFFASNSVGKQIAQQIKTILLNSSSAASSSHNPMLIKRAKPRGIMWEMATDPSLAVTVFHLLERASFAVPLGFLLLPLVKMIRSPFAGLDLGRILPPRASHRSVELEELAKRLDLVDKMLSRALRPSHREAVFIAGR